MHEQQMVPLSSAFSISVRNDEGIVHDFVSVYCEKGKSYFIVWHVWEVTIATYWSGIQVLESEDVLRKDQNR